MKLRLYVAAAAALAFAGCREIPDYQAGPAISLKEVKKTNVTTPGGLAADQLEFIINFTDGDGDLGLNPTDDNPPFQYSLGTQVVNGDTVDIINPNHYNWHTTFYTKQNGQFVPYVFPAYGLSYNGRFPRLAPDGQTGPLDGTITYKIQLEHLFFAPNTVAKFDILIMDRALNVSNKIETGEIILNQQ